MKTNEIVKNRIKELVDNTNISKTECAKQIGISYNTLHALYTHGKVTRIGIIYKIAVYFNVSTDYILGRSNDKQIKSHRQ